MKTVISAGLCMYKYVNNELHILLGHPGGPLHKQGHGTWGFPKGKVEEHETDLLETAIREFEEETGLTINKKIIKKFIPLGSIHNSNINKDIYIFAFEGDLPDKFVLNSNECEIEYPKKSGNKITIKELDDLRFFNISIASLYINEKQKAFIRRLENILSV